MQQKKLECCLYKLKDLLGFYLRWCSRYVLSLGSIRQYETAVPLYRNCFSCIILKAGSPLIYMHNIHECWHSTDADTAWKHMPLLDQSFKIVIIVEVVLQLIIKGIIHLIQNTKSKHKALILMFRLISTVHIENLLLVNLLLDLYHWPWSIFTFLIHISSTKMESKL